MCQAKELEDCEPVEAVVMMEEALASQLWTMVDSSLGAIRKVWDTAASLLSQLVVMSRLNTGAIWDLSPDPGDPSNCERLAHGSSAGRVVSNLGGPKL
jgi:hypothetical protein